MALLRLLGASLACLLCVNAAAFEVLFVGNSLTTRNEVPGKVAALSRTLFGVEPTVATLARNGASLTDHPRSGDLKRRQRERRFDIVVLQDIGGVPFCDPAFPGRATSEAGLRESSALARASGARVIWYATWQSKPAFQRRMGELARTMATRLDVELVEVGAAMGKWSDADRPALLPDGHPTELGSWIVATALLSASMRQAAPMVRDVEPCRPNGSCATLSAEDLAAIIAAARQAR